MILSSLRQQERTFQPCALSPVCRLFMREPPPTLPLRTSSPSPPLRLERREPCEGKRRMPEGRTTPSRSLCATSTPLLVIMGELPPKGLEMPMSAQPPPASPPSNTHVTSNRRMSILLFRVICSSAGAAGLPAELCCPRRSARRAPFFPGAASVRIASPP